MPTPSSLRVAQLRDKLQGSDFIVHEVVDVEPTSSDDEYESDTEEFVAGVVEVEEIRNVSGGSNEMTEEAERMLKEKREREQWEQVVRAGQKGKGGGGKTVTPEKEKVMEVGGEGGEHFGID